MPSNARQVVWICSLVILSISVCVVAYNRGRADANACGSGSGSGAAAASIPAVPQTRTLPQARFMHAKFVRTASKFAEQFMNAKDEARLLARFKDRAETLPPSVNLWQARVGVVDQGPWGACTAFAMRYALVGTAAAKAASLSTPLPVEPSKAWIYAQSRRRYGLPLSQDTGATNTDTAAVIASLGVVSEAIVPYYASNVILTTTAAQRAILNETRSKSAPQAFVSVPFGRNTAATLFNIKSKLAAKNYVIIAIQCFESFMTTGVLVSGTVPLPSAADVRSGALGGHAIALYGYDDARQLFLFVNSWGAHCGNKGMFTIPYSYVANPAWCGDMWSL